MITVRRSDERGGADHGWLQTRHAFSFADYHDREWMGFRTLRVINDDVVQPSGGFATHPHRDMEIVSYVVRGALQHRDSMGNGSVIRPGDVQRMTAGTGVTHSEYNPSDREDMRLLQIWILPERTGLTPGYEQVAFPVEERQDQLRLVASRDGREGSVTVHQDAEIRAALVSPGSVVRHELAPGRAAWVQVVRGKVRLGDVLLSEGDGAALTEEPAVSLAGVEHAEVLVFDLA